MWGEMLAGRRCVVTGGCGFIGGHLVDRLLGLPGTEVLVIDDARFGRHTPTETAEIQGRYTCLRHRLGPDSRDVLAKRLRADDIVFHLAAEKLHQSHDDQTALIDSNVHGTWQVLDTAGQVGASRVVLASSLYAHGRMKGAPLREDDLPRPTTVYGSTKLAGEHLLEAVRKSHGVKGVALRFFFTYGPRQFGGTGYRSVIVRNFQRLAQGLPPTIRGDGRQALDYIHVGDVVRALILAAEAELDGEVVNIGSGNAVSILDLTQKMQQTAGTNFAPEFIAADFTANSFRQADTTKAREKLGFQAEIRLEEGLAATWDWIRQETA